MKGIALLFFVTATMAVVLGMAWGIQMGISKDHTLGGAHAHLNLVGWVTMALYGIYYHLTPGAAGKLLAKIHYVVALVGVVLMVPGIAMSLRQQGETLAIAGSNLVMLSGLIFLVTVLMHARRPA